MAGGRPDGHRLARAGGVRPGATVWILALDSERVVFRHGPYVLVARRPAVAGPRAAASGGGSALPLHRDVAVRRAFSVSGVLRSRRLPTARSGTFALSGFR